jgi:hypothetical protein
MTVPTPARPRAYPLALPAAGRRSTLALVLAIAQLLTDHGYPPIASGGDLTALQDAIDGFIYAPPDGS